MTRARVQQICCEAPPLTSTASHAWSERLFSVVLLDKLAEITAVFRIVASANLIMSNHYQLCC